LFLHGIGIAVLIFVLFVSVIKFRYPVRYYDIILKYSALYGVDPALICAVIHAESKFNEDAVSPKGASGLMQLMEGTADWMAEVHNIPDYSFDRIFEPALNISIGTKYLSWLLSRYYDVNVAIAAYNAGNGNVDRWLNDPEFSSDGIHLDYIPFRETRDFVRRVQFNRQVYDFILAIKNTYLEISA
jgi:soluble lytic murein transglycosylase